MQVMTVLSPDGAPLFSLEYVQHIADWMGWMLPVYAYMLAFLYTWLHEAGHALAAVSLGTRVTHFQVGAPVWFRCRPRRVILKFGLLKPTGGVTYRYADDAPRWKVMLTALAGPLFPVFLTVPIFHLVGIQPMTVAAGFMVTVQTLANLNPFMRGTDGRKVFLHLHALSRGRRTLDT